MPTVVSFMMSNEDCACGGCLPRTPVAGNGMVLGYCCACGGGGDGNDGGLVVRGKVGVVTDKGTVVVRSGKGCCASAAAWP